MSTSRSTSAMLSALGKHPVRFCDKELNYSPSTVEQGLEKIKGHQTALKGVAIAGFNATHQSDNVICPVMHASFLPDPKTLYAKNVHLGTTRIWRADGSIDEARWKQFAEFVTQGQLENETKIVMKSRLMAYLQKCYDEDPQQLDTGRNDFALFASKRFQGQAACAGWNEVYDRLTCGWKPSEADHRTLEPYITLALVRQFFEDSTIAFQKAEDGELPVPHPNLTSSYRGP